MKQPLPSGRQRQGLDSFLGVQGDHMKHRTNLGRQKLLISELTIHESRHPVGLLFFHDPVVMSSNSNVLSFSESPLDLLIVLFLLGKNISFEIPGDRRAYQLPRHRRSMNRSAVNTLSNLRQFFGI